jgi:hypothetical protein
MQKFVIKSNTRINENSLSWKISFSTWSDADLLLSLSDFCDKTFYFILPCEDTEHTKYIGIYLCHDEKWGCMSYIMSWIMQWNVVLCYFQTLKFLIKAFFIYILLFHLIYYLCMKHTYLFLPPYFSLSSKCYELDEMWKYKTKLYQLVAVNRIKSTEVFSLLN